ncbi:sugar ABC transporter permease [Clostridium tagluense]|uniref:carbohydrate ABC transporter permease n=1 Tax=Clostridium tagluense TaxID=360422 RepID=UPI001CF395A1|nr:sugar ABC transporter permease [Clostridium tagluense]MCB2311496.1 sugar ABC transporter permease [Clostridium tagluense]MCB2316220.1 sugar ABC transporter permease [Clostridium tagluense]MCB2320976.1 sugar ABC transporter permease [Clostridium tagluense]MCB2325993.1 sugar ABC transporter permease [Clostridium tagluense]MCB2330716.1 sugar ABC transporter permease [Clostridium tagluense]
MKKIKLKNNNMRALLYLLPALVIIGIFQFYPIFKSFTMGFYTKFDYLTDRVYQTGLGNFAYVLKDPDFHLALRNTCVFAFFAAPLGIIVALIIALILNTNIRFKKFFVSAYFLPFVTSTTAVSIVWRWMLNNDYGLANAFLGVIGMAKVSWLTDSTMTIPILVALSIWKGLGYKIIIILAGLQSVDKRYELAARMDGASKFHRIWHITIPIIKPTMVFLSITSIIGAFKLFDEVYILYSQKPGPLQSGLTIVYYIFDKFYRHWEFATASAAAFILFIMILILTIIQFVFTRAHKEE